MAYTASSAHGYVCMPHEKRASSVPLDLWKKSINILDLYFATATFSSESLPYFPNKANHYIIGSFSYMDSILEDIKKIDMDKSAFIFNLSDSLFERIGERLNYISMYFTRYRHTDLEIVDLANVIAKRERVKKASLAKMQFFTTEPLRFAFPYSENIVVLELEGDKTHQSDLKYCERTRRDVARKGISLNNLVSLSILEKLK